METIFSGRQKPGDHKTGRRDGRQIDVPPGDTATRQRLTHRHVHTP